MTTCFSKIFVDAFALRLLFIKSRLLFIHFNSAEAKHCRHLLHTIAYIETGPKRCIYATRMHGRRKDFFQGGGHYGIFPKYFQGGAKSGEIWFLPLEIEKTTFFAEIFKIRGTNPPCPPFRRPCAYLCMFSGV